MKGIDLLDHNGEELLPMSRGVVQKDIDIVKHSTIYEIDFNANSKINVVPMIYAEGFAKEDVPTFIDGNVCGIISRRQTYATNYTTDVIVSNANGASKKITIPVRRISPEKAYETSPKVMCIGDSLTNEGYPNVLEWLFRNCGYENDALMVGTVKRSLDISFNGFTNTCNTCHEGRGGYAVTSYYRHVVFTIPYDRELPDANGFYGKDAWDSLGLGTMTRKGIKGREYVQYTGTPEQNALICTTCHGYYDADPTENLWYALNGSSNNLKTFTLNGTKYTFGKEYSTNDDELQKKAIEFLCKECTSWYIVPFYDYETVQSTNGETAFNLAKYIERYKTLNDDGKTRLVLGDTAGTRVYDVGHHDLCTPTHVVIIMTENDHGGCMNYPEVVSNTISSMATKIKEQFPQIKVAVGSTRRFGALNRSYYYHVGLLDKFTPEEYYIKVNEALKSNEGKYTFLNIYQTTTPIGKSVNAINPLTGDTFLIMKDSIHTNLERYVDRANQVFAWILSTL